MLGVLIARAAGQPLDVVLRERVFEPLGMVDTGFATSNVDRRGTCYTGTTVYDPPNGQWATPPAFGAGGGGTVSTVDDFHAFARMLMWGGAPLISPASVAAMTTSQVDVGPSPDGSQGWGFGVGVQLRRVGLARSVGSYGWDGGLGSSWVNDPAERLIGVVLTTDVFTSAFPPPRVIQDFWTCVYAAASTD